MPTEEQMLKIAEGIRKQSERHGFPTVPNKKKRKPKDERKLAVLAKIITDITPK